MANPLENPDVARRQLEEEIDGHLRAILALRTRINRLAPISKLPPETLAEIFISYTNHWDDLNDRLPSHYSYWSWITILHVCVYWRTVALESPRLWSHIAVTVHSKWMSEVVCRSKQAPLSVKAYLGSGYGGRKLSALEMILRELPRIYGLRVSASRSVLESILLTTTGTSKLLQDLVLTVPIDARSSRDAPLPLTIVVTGQAVHLRTLELDGYPFPWGQVLSTPFLRRLRVVQHVDDSSPEMLDVIRTLEQLPLLESLALDGVLSIPSSGASSFATKKVALPLLGMIKLGGETSACASLLHRLDLPTSIVVTATCFFSEGMTILGDVVAQITASKERLVTLSLQNPDVRLTCVRGSCLDVPPESLIDANNKHLSFDLAFASRMLVDILRMTLLFTDRFSLSSVRNLELSTLAVSEFQWYDFLTRMPQVRSLRLSGPLAICAYRMLQSQQEYVAASMGQGGTSDCSWHFLPCLRRLHINSVKLGNPIAVTSTASPAIMDDLYHFLSIQRDNGSLIGELVLQSCGDLNRVDVERLKEVTDTVTWDRTSI